MKDVKAIIFDIDGVLADSREAVVVNTKLVMQEFGFSIPSWKVEKMSTAHSAESVLISLAPSLSKDQGLLSRMLARLSEITRENLHLVKPTPLAKSVPALSKKYLFAAATNRKASAKMVLERLGLIDYFSAVLTSADAPPKPNPKMIRLCLEKLKVSPWQALFIGDNIEDMQAGKAAGVKTIRLDGTDEKAASKLISRLLRTRIQKHKNNATKK
ncbi:MAG: HAD family hydrolase [Candidatus Anstonellaceae archaeon]